MAWGPLGSPVDESDVTGLDIASTTNRTEEQEIDLCQLLYALIRSAWAIILVAVLAAAAGFVYTRKTFVPAYTATTSMVVNAKYNQTYSGKDQQVPTTSDINLARDLTETYKVVLKSDRIMNGVISKLGIDMDAETLSKNVTLTNEKDTQVLFLTATATDAHMAVRIANTITEIAPQVMMEAVDIGSVNVLDKAVEAKPVPSNLLRNTALGALVGLMLGAGGVLLMTLLFPRIRNSADIGARLGLPTMGEVMHQRGRRGANVLFDEPNAPQLMKEPYQYMSLVLRLAAGKGKLKRVLVTSALPGEGKTTVAINLCMALAASGKRVVLLDFDTRKQSVHRVLNIAPEGMQDFVQALRQADQIDGLSRCMAEVTPGFVTIPFVQVAQQGECELFACPAFERTVAVLEQFFDFIVFDSMPAYPVATTVDLARFADGVILVVRQEQTAARVLMDTQARLVGGGAKMVGAVLNDIRYRHVGSGYTYQKKKYYE